MPEILNEGEPHRIVIRESRSPKQAHEQELVLAAADLPYVRVQRGKRIFIAVHPDIAERALSELTQYEQENRGWPPRRPDLELLSDGRTGPFLFSALVFMVFILQREGALGHDWVEVGAARARLIANGEWWRAVTALTLHADLHHLLSNILFGALFTALLCQLTGTGAALGAVFASGVLGNLANAWIQDPMHSSIGASTAVFGALGCLVGYQLADRKRIGLGTLERFAPPLLGLVFLGWMGTGSGSDPGVPQDGAKVDVWAHAMGFAAGGLSGAVLGWLGLERLRSRALQWSAVFCSAAILIFSWAKALGEF